METFLIPDGWSQEPLPRDPDHLVIRSGGYMVTIDFSLRGFRDGYSTTGPLHGEPWNKKRKTYGGRGWKQALVDDAVARLKEVGA